jgi:hypothetical protein
MLQGSWSDGVQSKVFREDLTCWRPMWSMLWSMEVSHGVSEYGRSTGVSYGVREYYLEYGSIIWSAGV